jgi:hypothetical protein
MYSDNLPIQQLAGRFGRIFFDEVLQFAVIVSHYE